MNNSLNTKNLVGIALILISVINIQLVSAETGSNPIINGFEKVKLFFTKASPSQTDHSQDINNQYDAVSKTHQSKKDINPQTEKVIQNNFEQLSSGNKKIAQALYRSQNIERTSSVISANTLNNKYWTLDKIAFTNSELNSWGQVFNQMKSENLIKEQNLGQVIRNHSDFMNSKSNKQENSVINSASNKKQAIVITNARGEYLVINRTNSKGPDNL